jgi:hypothetical protein
LLTSASVILIGFGCRAHSYKISALRQALNVDIIYFLVLVLPLNSSKDLLRRGLFPRETLNEFHVLSYECDTGYCNIDCRSTKDQTDLRDR